MSFLHVVHAGKGHDFAPSLGSLDQLSLLVDTAI